MLMVAKGTTGAIPEDIFQQKSVSNLPVHVIGLWVSLMTHALNLNSLGKGTETIEGHHYCFSIPFLALCCHSRCNQKSNHSMGEKSFLPWPEKIVYPMLLLLFFLLFIANAFLKLQMPFSQWSEKWNFMCCCRFCNSSIVGPGTPYPPPPSLFTMAKIFQNYRWTPNIHACWELIRIWD